MRNLAAMVQKVKGVQEKLAAVRQQLAEIRCEGEAAGGLIKATVTGGGRLVALSIDQKALAAQEDGHPSLLEDAIISAVTAAQDQAKTEKESLIREVTGGLPLPPGLDFPF